MREKRFFFVLFVRCLQIGNKVVENRHGDAERDRARKRGGRKRENRFWVTLNEGADDYTRPSIARIIYISAHLPNSSLSRFWSVWCSNCIKRNIKIDNVWASAIDRYHVPVQTNYIIQCEQAINCTILIDAFTVNWIALPFPFFVRLIQYEMDNIQRCADGGGDIMK